MKKVILLLSLLSTQLKSQSNVWDYIQDINDSIVNIPTIVEGYVESVSIYAGDDSGNRIPYSQANWVGDVGYPQDSYGNEAYGFTEANIWICKIYKNGGALDPMSIYKVITKSQSIDNVIFKRRVNGTMVDTITDYVYVQPSGQSEFNIFMPHPTWPKRKLFFCTQADQYNGADYSGKLEYTNFRSIYRVDFDLEVDIQRADGSFDRVNAYAGIVPYAFYSQDSLDLFLSMIQTIDPNPTEYCGTFRHGQTVPPQVDVTLYPNPSHTGEDVKIISGSAIYITLKDVSGQIILTEQIHGSYTLPSSLTSGLYILELTGNGKTTYSKVVKN